MGLIALIVQTFYFLLKIALLFILLYLIKFIFNKIREYHRYFQVMYKIPGPPSLPILGHVLDFATNYDQIHYLLRELAIKYYPIYRLDMSYYMAANVFHPDDLEQVLTNIKHITKSKIYDIFLQWLCEGLLTSNGSKWQKRRKILTPAFHFGILQKFISSFNEETAQLVQELHQSEGKTINVLPLISDVTLKSIMETAMGTNNLDSNAKKDYRAAIHSVGKLFVLRIFRPWLYPEYLYVFTPQGREEARLVKQLHGISKSIIDARERTFDIDAVKASINDNDFSSRKRKLAMLDLLLLSKIEDNSIDSDGIREEVDTFLFEGHDTTAAAISFLLLLLANDREIQDKVYQEITEHVPENQEYPTFKNLQDMQYTERCIKEGLRLYPSVHFISRKTGEEFTTKTGYVIPKGSIVHMHIFDTHRIPEFWPDPEKFDPDRFLPENCKGRHPFSYIPFSAGPRNCIGQRFAMLEMKAVLCGILRSFILEPVDTPETVKILSDLVLRPDSNGIKMKFKKR